MSQESPIKCASLFLVQTSLELTHALDDILKFSCLKVIVELRVITSQCGFGKLSHNKVIQRSLSIAPLCLSGYNERSSQREKYLPDDDKNKSIFGFHNTI